MTDAGTSCATRLSALPGKQAGERPALTDGRTPAPSLVSSRALARGRWPLRASIPIDCSRGRGSSPSCQDSNYSRPRPGRCRPRKCHPPAPTRDRRRSAHGTGARRLGHPCGARAPRRLFSRHRTEPDAAVCSACTQSAEHVLLPPLQPCTLLGDVRVVAGTEGRGTTCHPSVCLGAVATLPLPFVDRSQGMPTPASPCLTERILRTVLEPVWCVAHVRFQSCSVV